MSPRRSRNLRCRPTIDTISGKDVESSPPCENLASLHRECGFKDEDIKCEPGAYSPDFLLNPVQAKRFVLTSKDSTILVDGDEEIDIVIEGEDRPSIRACWKDIIEQHLTSLDAQTTTHSHRQPLQGVAKAAVPLIGASRSERTRFPSRSDPDLFCEVGPDVPAFGVDWHHDLVPSSGTRVHKTFRLADQTLINSFFLETLEQTHQSEIKPILKAMIKFIEPGKQRKWPYVLSAGILKDPERKLRRDEGQDGNPQPPWWPDNVRHCEPDHLKKSENATLGAALLWHLVQDKSLNRKHNDNAIAKLFRDHIYGLIASRGCGRDNGEQDEESSGDLDDENITKADFQQLRHVGKTTDARRGYDTAPTEYQLELQVKKAATARRKLELEKKANARALRLTEVFRIAEQCSHASFNGRSVQDQIRVSYIELQDESSKRKKAPARARSSRANPNALEEIMSTPEHSITSTDEPASTSPCGQYLTRDARIYGKKRKAGTINTVEEDLTTRKRFVTRQPTAYEDDAFSTSSSNRSPPFTDSLVDEPLLWSETSAQTDLQTSVFVAMADGLMTSGPTDTSFLNTYTSSYQESSLLSASEYDFRPQTVTPYVHMNSSDGFVNLSSSPYQLPTASNQVTNDHVHYPATTFAGQLRTDLDANTVGQDSKRTLRDGTPMSLAHVDWIPSYSVTPETSFGAWQHHVL